MKMKYGLLAGVIPCVLAMSAVMASAAKADVLEADPSGFGEVPTLSSPAKADFHATINKDQTEIQYRLTYSGFTTPVLQSHIHLGRRAVNGGIVLFLCTNLGNGPAGTPACPTPAGTVTGTLTAASVAGGAAAQGINPGEFAKVIRAIRNQATYVNIHTQAFPKGEIRDQVKDFFLPGRK